MKKHKILWVSKIVSPEKTCTERAVAAIRLVKVFNQTISRRAKVIKSPGDPEKIIYCREPDLKGDYDLVMEIAGDYDLLGNPKWEVVKTFEPCRIPYFTSRVKGGPMWQMLENSAIDYLVSAFAQQAVPAFNQNEKVGIKTGYEVVWQGDATRVVKRKRKYRLEYVYQMDATGEPCWKESPMSSNNPAVGWKDRIARDFLKHIAYELEKEEQEVE